MDPLILAKILHSLVATITVLLLSSFFKKAAKKTQEIKKINKSRYFGIKRMISILSLVIFIVIIIFIWGIDIKNLWVSITSVVAMVAVAFFAVWSLIGNILAGFIIYFTTPFKINDTIEVLPDKIKGKVLAINSFYTIIIDKEQNYINIPNSLFFQKYIKKMYMQRPR